MADSNIGSDAQSSSQPEAVPPDTGPVLHPGHRPQASGVTEPPIEQVSAAVAPAAKAPDAAANKETASAGDQPEAAAKDPHQVLLDRLKVNQQLLQQCAALEQIVFDRLFMPNWPSDASLDKARKRRDVWLIALMLSGGLAYAGAASALPVLFSGVGFGLLTLLGLGAIPWVRRRILHRPGYADLLQQRALLLAAARLHIEQLEGQDGLAHHCSSMVDYNQALASSRFSGMIRLSASHQLVSRIRDPGHVRHYLLLVIESEKAYRRIRQAVVDDRRFLKAFDRQN